jgi:hypothetical protein
MTFKASFFELSMAYGLSAYVFGGVCIFGGIWHNVPATLLAFIGTIYCLARATECLAAWLNSKFHELFGAKSETRPKAESNSSHDLRGLSAPSMSAPHRGVDAPVRADRSSHSHPRQDYGRRLTAVS